MKAFVVHITDLGGVDERFVVEVGDRMDLGRAAQIALDHAAEKHGSRFELPVFLDIHPAPSPSAARRTTSPSSQSSTVG